MIKIEDCESPVIGDFYLVRVVKFKRNNQILNWPVIDKSHKDSKEDMLNENFHYHIDWRFMPEYLLNEHRKHNQRLYNGYWRNYENAEFLSPIMETEKLSEGYEERQYLRGFGETIQPSHNLINKFKNIKMKNMLCPHHGTKLISCTIKNKIVTCPNHGLKWNVETNNLVN